MLPRRVAPESEPPPHVDPHLDPHLEVPMPDDRFSLDG
jgi:hypothetical protein